MNRRQTLFIFCAVSTQNVTAGHIQMNLDFLVFKRCVQQFYKKQNKWFIWIKKVSKSSLTHEHKIAKLIFSKSHTFWNKKFLLFSQKNSI